MRWCFGQPNAVGVDSAAKANFPHLASVFHTSRKDALSMNYALSFLPTSFLNYEAAMMNTPPFPPLRRTYYCRRGRMPKE